MIIGSFQINYHPNSIDEQDLIYDYEPDELYTLNLSEEDAQKELIQRAIMRPHGNVETKKESETDDGTRN